MSSSARITRATLAKDIRLEWRSKDAINSMLFFVKGHDDFDTALPMG